VLDELTREARIYARVAPAQKLAIVLSMARNGNFVAVTGDGINDAPALKHAHVGVAMGRKGTEVAKESADIIITDDNVASIVSGIREGRVAYANIRKVVFMTVSTGAAEVVLVPACTASRVAHAAASGSAVVAQPRDERDSGGRSGCREGGG
jgi:Ca2+-transporting ATPase